LKGFQSLVSQNSLQSVSIPSNPYGLKITEQALNVLSFFCLKFGLLNTLYKTNVMGTLNMLGLAKRVGARFLLTSTSEVYGDPLEHPQKESYWGHVNPIGN
jgi:hypothetical protein